MPTADDFTLANAQAADYAKFASALNYIQGVFQSSGTVATVQGSTVRINHQGIDAYDASTGIIDWDPDSGLVVNNGGTSGVQSPAVGLYHEMAHKADPGFDWETPDQREAEATSVETTVAQALGEPIRATYTSTSGTVVVSNPTEHTSNGVWTQKNDDGSVQSGGTYPGPAPDLDDSGGGTTDPGTGDGDGGDDGTGGGGGDDGGGDGGGGGGGGGGDDDLGPIEEDRVVQTSRRDKVKPTSSDAVAGHPLAANVKTANVSVLSTPVAMQTASLRGASQLIQSMASFGVQSAALNQDHGFAGTVHPAEIGVSGGRHPARFVAALV